MSTAVCHGSDLLVVVVVAVLLLLLRFAPLVKCAFYGTHFCRCYDWYISGSARMTRARNRRLCAQSMPEGICMHS